MRKPRDIDTELKALQDKQRQLRAKRTTQLGELVAATGADAFDPETLAGALLAAIETAKKDADTKEAWQRKGEAFFRREKRKRAHGAGHPAAGTPDERGGPAPSPSSAAAE